MGLHNRRIKGVPFWSPFNIWRIARIRNICWISGDDFSK